MLKTVANPATGARFKLGRKPPRARCPRLSLHNYLRPGLPAPPPSGHYSFKAEHALAQPYLNTHLGDCVIAGPLHCIDTFMGNAGSQPTLFTDADVIGLYEKIGGFDPSKTDAQGNNPTDNGCDEQTMLNYWQTTGLVGHKIAGWVAVRPEDAKTAMWLWENLIYGVAMPDAWVTPPPEANGFVWDVNGDADPSNGHCFVGVGWNAVGIQIDSWGLIGTVTYAAIEKYASAQSQGELYSVITQEALDKATQKAPNGFAWDDLVRDFQAIGGSLVTPKPDQIGS